MVNVHPAVSAVYELIFGLFPQFMRRFKLSLRVLGTVYMHMATVNSDIYRKASYKSP
jgi:hypothetical protein